MGAPTIETVAGSTRYALLWLQLLPATPPLLSKLWNCVFTGVWPGPWSRPPYSSYSESVAACRCTKRCVVQMRAPATDTARGPRQSIASCSVLNLGCGRAGCYLHKFSVYIQKIIEYERASSNIRRMFAFLAQLAERWSHNPEVASSSLAESITQMLLIRETLKLHIFLFFARPQHAICGWLRQRQQ